MAQQKRSTNPLLGPAVSGFSLSESFGPQAAVIVPAMMQVSQPEPPKDLRPPIIGPYTSSPADGSSAFGPPSNFKPSISPMAPPTLGPPPAGVFLLPARGTSPGLTPIPLAQSHPMTLNSSIGPPPTMSPFSNTASTTIVQSKRSPYVPPPGVRSSASSTLIQDSSNLGPLGPIPTLPSSTSVPSFNDQARFSSFNNEQPSGFLGGQSYGDPTQPRFDIGSSALPPTVPAGGFHQAMAPLLSPMPKATEMAYHWFYKINSPPPANGSPNSGTEIWKPFTMIDSCAIEEIYTLNKDTNEPIPTDGGRFDVFIKDRKKTAVYWQDDKNDNMEIRRCSWFFKSNLDGRWIPFDEDLSAKLEIEYVSGVETRRWNRRLEIGTGEYVSMHAENIIVYFPSNKSTISGALDDWGQVQPPTDPLLKPREVHRGLDGLPEIPDGESLDVDHLVFIVHGIGSVCDMKFRTITEVVDGFRELAEDMSQKHFQSAHLAGRANRVEFLPVNWHKTLHGQDTGTDERLKPLSLKSIPKMRGFINDTLLDILFYTSPIYCQTIIDTVVNEINRMYTLFMARNESFKGQVSIIGHSLGSLIVFDILSHQMTDEQNIERETAVEKTTLAAQNLSLNEDLTLEQVFSKLEIIEFAEAFTKEGIDLDALIMCSEDDLKEGGLPLGPRKKLLKYLEGLKAAQESGLTGLEKYQQQSVESDVKYIFGPAGTGQPSVHYPRLDMQLSSFYALGSPLAMFLAVRGIDSLGPNFSFPTCPKFYNIFHPFDPVAYRVEGLIKSEYGLTLRPVTIPHHKGRKRMHLELKDTVTKIMSTDIKQKILDSLSSTFNAMYSIAVGNTYDASGSSKSVGQVVEQEMEEKARVSDQLDSQNPNNIDSRLNLGNRIDYSLQEAPLESFNEYLFALAAHLCYWESEDTCLMIVKDIYSQMNVISDDQLSTGFAQPAPPANVPYLSTGVGKPPKVEHSNFMTPQQPPAMIDPAEIMDLQQPQHPPVPVTPIPTFPAASSSYMPGPVASAGGNRIRPAYPKAVPLPAAIYNTPPGLGMDPTAPPAYDAKPPPPPPTTGFVKK